ncbi:MAG TPA: Panacea domain-containing protein, partial [Salinarimonas sp.]|nr:Panacea domain-containing protein [Salinarimonas sp.]
ILYVAAKCEEDETFGAVKLNKLLFFCDFAAYVRFGAPITGARYQKLPQGPAPRALLPLKRELEDARRAIERAQLRFGRYRQKRLVPLDDPQMDVFTAEEIALVDEIIERTRHLNANEISELSHDISSGWQLVAMNEDIPYLSARVPATPLPLTEEESQWAADECARLGI